MTGDAPQPGETPRTESNPWSLADPGISWWRGGSDPRDGTDPRGATTRHPRRRRLQTDPTDAGPGAEARSSAARDVARELDPAIRQRAAEPAAEASRIEPAGIECDHDNPDPYRYDPLRPPAASTADPAVDSATAVDTATAGTTTEPDAEPTTLHTETDQAPQPTELTETVPVEQSSTGDDSAEAGPAAGEPDVMVLPEPNVRNRPTVALDRGPVPGQARARTAEPMPRATGDPATDARLEKLENSPFWLDEAQRAATVVPLDVAAHTDGRSRPRHAIRRPAPALLALLTLALVATFFAWVSAEPFWLAVGHGTQGYATTSACTGSGVTQRCAGTFTAADGGFTASRVTLLGVGSAERSAGVVAPARMVSTGSRQAYLGDTGVLVHLRWILGFALVLICGYGIAALTGARRLDRPRARRVAMLASMAAPVVLLAGFLAAAY